MDFIEARDSEWQWHQLGRMQVCTSLQTDNHASTPPLSLTDRMPFLPPNQQRESTETTPSTRFSKVGPCSIEMLGLGCESYFPFHFLLFDDAFLWSYSKILWELVAPEFVEALFS